MATRPTKAQAKAASTKLTGQQVAELVANADPEVTGREMQGAGVVERACGVGKLSFRLKQRGPVGSFVYLEKHGSLLHERAFLKQPLLKNARHLRLHRGGTAARGLSHECGVEGHVHAFEFHRLHERRRKARPGGRLFSVLIAGDKRKTQQRSAAGSQDIHELSS